MSKLAINGVKEWELNLPESSYEEWQGNMKYHKNQWEMLRLKKMEQFVKDTIKAKGQCIVMYIGAYKGDMAALMAKWGAKMIIMESTPAFWTLIEETWKMNPELPQPIGLWSGLVGKESDGKAYETKNIYDWPIRKAEYIEGHVGFTHLAESHDDPTFPRITIDDFIAATGIVPDLITMDVEGSELEILYGGVNTIKNHNAAYMLSVHPEFMFHNHGTYERELHDLLRDNGYHGEWIDYDHEHHWWYTR